MLHKETSNQLTSYRWTDQCTPGHDKNRLTPEFPVSVGQNWAEMSNSQDFGSHKLEDLVQMWYDEVNLNSTLIIHVPKYMILHELSL